MEASIRLFELNEFLRRTIALNFPSLQWVRCEIAQLKESRGHYYLTLVEKGEEDLEIIAQSEAIIWQRDYRRIRRKVGINLEVLLQEGIEVLVQVRVEYHERYGLSLAIQDLEGDYSMGKIALRRRETIQHLRKAGLMEKNKQLSLPPVLQRLAVISASTAAGFQDYQQHLSENPYSYRFYSRLFTAAMQGIHSSLEIRNQVEIITKQAADYDAVLIIRGGGAKLDLIAFDELELAKSIAHCPIPVLVGIGHEVDETVLDLVAHRSLKTPTAVADFILHHNSLFESQLLHLGQDIQNWSWQKIRQSDSVLQQAEQVLQLESRSRLREERRMLDYLDKNLPLAARRTLSAAEKQLENIDQSIHLLSPEECLRRGYSITLHKGKAITAATDLKAGDLLETRLQGRQIASKVIKDE